MLWGIMQMRIEISPFDTLFFRDGKPFTMGEESGAAGIFPPPPSVFYGALRTAYFASHPEDLHKANTLADPTKNLEINGIFYKYGNSFYFPMPLDCVKEKRGNQSKVFLMSRSAKPVSSVSTEQVLRPLGNTEVENIDSGLFNDLTLQKYLQSESNEFNYLDPCPKLIMSEPKTGIGRDNATHSVKEGMLYSIEMKRMVNLSFVVDFEGLELPEKGFIKLGGEKKAACYHILSQPGPLLKFHDNFSEPLKMFKIYFATPAVFEKGWIPSWIDDSTLIGKIPNTNIEVRLIAAAVGKPISIGGFDIKLRMPKPMRKVVPSGSVYYFEIQGNSFSKSDLGKIHGKSISEYETAKQGFGICYVGGVK